MNLGHWANGAWANGSWVASSWSVTAAVVAAKPIAVGGGFDWRTQVEERNRKLHLQRLLAKARKKAQKLVEKAKEAEREIVVARKSEKPIEGILARYEELSMQVAEQRLEIKSIKLELNHLIGSLPAIIQAQEDEEDEDILLLL